jgi:threonine-phosphate decarboxylase
VEQGAGARLLLLGSFTKYFFCPGIRLGFAVARPETLDRLLAVRAPWMVSDHAQGVGQAMLRRLGEYRAARADLPRRREALRRGLLQTGLFAWACRPAANFVTLRLARSTPRVLAEFLLARRMVVRTCDNITGMPPGYVRIQVKDDAENAALISAIAEFPG